MKKAVILVAFGTTNIDGIKNSVDILVDELNKSLDDEFKIIKVFTSNFIREKLKLEFNYHILSLEEALKQLETEEYEQVYIKPLYIFNGGELKKIKTIVEEKQYSFKTLLLGSCLLKNLEEDYDESYKIISTMIMDELYKKVNKSSNILFIGHGSKKFKYPEYEVFIRYVNRIHEGEIFFGTLEGSESIDCVLKTINNSNINSVNVVSLLMMPGKHYYRDICSCNGSWISKLNSLDIDTKVLNKCLLEYESIRKLITNQIRDMK